MTGAEIVAWTSLAVSFASAAVILADELGLGNRQQTAVMNAVHPITSLYWGPVWEWAYFRDGRLSSRRVMRHDAKRAAARGVHPRPPQQLRPWHLASAVSHCGAGCTLGDVAGGWIVFALGPWTIAPTGTFGPELVLDFAIAWTLGILFQYATIVPMREDVSGAAALWLTVRADTLSILAFQIGLFGWMALSHFVLWQPSLPIDSPTHWWMMQVGMAVGFFTAWPVNAWLIHRGWKEKMDRRRHLAHMVEQLREAA